MQEASYWDASCFLTLTYNDGNLPVDLGLHKRDLQLFFKRLRKDIENKKIKYFACGEYGERSSRPHYHAIIFGLGLCDETFKIIGRSGKASKVMLEAWKYGFAVCGNVTYQSARYVAGYIQKKYSGPLERLNYEGREPPFQLQSQGLGKRWCLDNSDNLVTDLSFTVNGVRHSMPRYYRKVLEDRISDETLLMRSIQTEVELNEFLEARGMPYNERSVYKLAWNMQRERELKTVVERWKNRD